tara:strand:- start:4172 stop:5998 length:1827 start_codon:yes stop_codon:yes gene_type:complete
MKRISEILFYTKNYRLNVVLNVFFHLLTSVFSLFSFAAIAPFLAILFKTTKQVTVVKPAEFTLTTGSILDNMNYFLSSFIAEHGEEGALMLLCFVLVFMYLLKNTTNYLAMFHIARVRAGVVKVLREKIYTKILALPLSFFTNERKGDILTKSTSDVTEVEISMVGALEILFRDPVKFVLYLGTLFLMSWELTLFVLVLLPISAFVITRIGKSLKRKAKKGQFKMGEVIAIMEETLSGMRIIKAFNAEKELQGKFNQQNERHFNLMTKIHRRHFLAAPLSELMGAILISIILWFGGKMVLDNDAVLSGEFFITFIVIFSQLIPPAKKFSDAFFRLQKGSASLDRIKEVLNADLKVKEATNPIAKKDFTTQLNIENLSFKYDQDWVLNKVNLKINKGETVALVGASGGGKSTLADMIPRFYDPQDGNITIDGVNLKDIPLADVRNLMGVVSQESILFNDSISNNITLGSESKKLEDVKAAAHIANAKEFIEDSKLGYDSSVGERGTMLSGGQRQRVSIARAVFKNPPILILDEATSALDTESEKLVQDALNNLMKNRTSIVIAHRLSTIQHADKIVVIERGKIVEVGTHKDLIALNGFYTKLTNLQTFD